MTCDHQLATVDQKFVDVFKAIEAQMSSITSQRLTLQNLETQAILMRDKNWDSIIETYHLPTLAEITKDGLFLQINYETRKITLETKK